MFPTDPGEFAMLWTVRLAVACYLVRVFAALRGVSAADSAGFVRPFWTAGAALLFVHVLLVFHVVHDWSHAAAWEHTAERTEAYTGWRWGGGLWLNHLMTSWWLLDAGLWWWRGPAFPNRAVAYTRSLHGFFAFMVFNATVVFGPWGWTVVAVLVTAGFAAARFTRTDRVLLAE